MSLFVCVPVVPRGSIDIFFTKEKSNTQVLAVGAPPIHHPPPHIMTSALAVPWVLGRLRLMRTSMGHSQHLFSHGVRGKPLRKRWTFTCILRLGYLLNKASLEVAC